MKKYLIAIIGMVLLSLTATCKKDPEVNIAAFEITKENLTVGADRTEIMGTYSYPGKIDAIRALISENEYHFNQEEYSAELNGKNFAVAITDLKPATTYYYCYSVDYGASSDYETETKSFTTGDYTLPVIITATVSYVGHDNALCGGEVTDDGGAAVTARGVCWAQQPNPTIQDNHTVDSCGTGIFISELKNLTLNTKYYVRAYATNAKGTAYGNDMEFTTSAQAPEVKTEEVMDVTETTVRVKCDVVSTGGSDVTERGVCWSKAQEPTLDDEHQANGAGLGMYISKLTGLDDNTTYYVRAYAKNNSGLGFGEVLTFTTSAQMHKPAVTTVEVIDVTATTAICVGNVSSDGGAEVTERGACWSTAENPTTSGTHLANGSGTGSFTVSMTGLIANKTYYVRTYATNSQGTAYGEQKTFTTTEGLAVVTTGSVTEVTATTARCGGTVTDQGASAVTERGICWSTSHNPTTSGSHATSGTGTGSFTASMTGLTTNATYYVRAYATNSAGTAYGDEVSFTALEGLAVVTTDDVTDITATTAKCGGTVTDQGASAVTERGICWSTSHNPTTTDAHANGGTGAGNYTCTMTSLAPGITYYVRAYATNSEGTSYGEEKQFTTGVNKPTVTTNSVTDITQTTATGGGNVTNDGGATVTERGICWSTSHNPTTSGNHTANGTGTGSFTVQMTGLTAGTTYYVRAYATNSQGTGYGSEVSFTTTANLPTVTTAQVSNITQTTALGGGNVTNDGGASVTERGICWSTSHNPTTSGSHATSGTGTGGFTVDMTGLAANTTYYVRAYAVNSQGTAYGNEVSFTTSQDISAPTVTTSDVTNITQTTAQGGGNVTNDGGAAVTERGICWSTSHNPTTSGSHASGGTGIGNFTVQMTGLTANTTYYVRAYATNSQGTSYGSEVSFTTLSDTNPDELTFTVNGVSFTMIPVEGGTFWMGAQRTDPNGQNYDSQANNDESPVHQVTLSDFYMGETEVTQALWQAVTGSNPSHFTGDNNRPVEQVSWNDCQTFISQLNALLSSQLGGRQFALPTEAEWEFAARGGNQSHGYKYSGSNTIGDVAWYIDNSSNTTHAVGTKQANELELYDMSGNVMEWCYDRAGEYSSDAQTNPTGPTSGSYLVNRGGSCYNKAWCCRVSDRNEALPSSTDFSLGLRLVLCL